MTHIRRGLIESTRRRRRSRVDRANEPLSTIGINDPARSPEAFTDTTAIANDAGMTLLELMVVVGIVSVGLVAAVVVMPGLVKQSRADSASALLLNTLRLARDRAISERRNMDVVLTTPNHVQVVREGIGGVPNATVIDVYLEGNQRFMKFGSTPDTPSQFGLINSPLAFGPTQGTQPTIMFTSEGTLVDASGDPINGSIFLGAAGDVSSSRAVTIFGPTALIRAFRWNGQAWVE